MNGPRPFPAHAAVVIALLLSLPTLQHLLTGDLSVASGAVRFGFALCAGALAVQLVRAVLPPAAVAPEEEPPAAEPDEVPVPARRAEDLLQDEPPQAA